MNGADTPLDQYGERNYEDIEALDINLFNQNMKDLLPERLWTCLLLTL